MNIDLNQLPVPKYKKKKLLKHRATRYGKDVVHIKTVKYIDSLFDKEYLMSYFNINKKKDTIVTPPTIE